MSTLMPVEEFVQKLIANAPQFQRWIEQYPIENWDQPTFENWLNLFSDWMANGAPDAESAGPTSSIPDEVPFVVYALGHWSPQEVRPQTQVKSSSDEPTISISENHWDEVPLDWKPQEASSAPWNDESWINPGWPVD